jgi:DNA-binding PadR family transcriptional regulator
MSLAHAILVCLSDAPMTGYELAKRFDSSVGFFWHATHQQIYRELSSLADKGWVSGKTVAQATRPNKTVFKLKAAGRTELLSWSRRPTQAAAVKEELLLRFYALPQVDLPVLVQQLHERRHGHQERLALYEKILARYYANPSQLDLAATGKLLGLRAGLRLEQHWIDWSADAIAMLESETDVASAGASARRARSSPQPKLTAGRAALHESLAIAPNSPATSLQPRRTSAANDVKAETKDKHNQH